MLASFDCGGRGLNFPYPLASDCGGDRGGLSPPSLTWIVGLIPSSDPLSVARYPARRAGRCFPRESEHH